LWWQVAVVVDLVLAVAADLVDLELVQRFV
jgi:hypothetical protein